MVKPTIEEIRASDLTPLEQELALASFGVHGLPPEPEELPQPKAAPRTAAPHDPRHGHSASAFAAASRDAAPSAAQAAARPAPDPVLANNPHMNAWRGHLDGLRARNAIARPMRACGRLTRAAGLVLEAVGLRLSVGAEVMIELPQGSSLPMAEAEVVGFAGDKLFLMPTTEVIGLLPGARVYPLESAPIADPMAGAKRLPVGWELLGRVLDASGRPLDGLGPLGAKMDAPLSAPTINPLNREPIHKVLDVGVRAINALLTVGRGQRMGLFAGSGVGKSVLLGTMARYTSAEVIVIGLIGERGREVKEFIEQILGEDGLARSVVVAGGRLAAAAHASRRLLDLARRIFSRSGQACAAADGLADPLCDGPARNCAGRRRAAGHQRLPTLGVCQAAGARRAHRQRSGGRRIDYGVLHSIDRGRRPAGSDR
jgi:flagellum-specific ATP synthase